VEPRECYGRRRRRRGRRLASVHDQEPTPASAALLAHRRNLHAPGGAGLLIGPAPPRVETRSAVLKSSRALLSRVAFAFRLARLVRARRLDPPRRSERERDRRESRRRALERERRPGTVPLPARYSGPTTRPTSKIASASARTWAIAPPGSDRRRTNLTNEKGARVGRLPGRFECLCD
jgi:hypothetical protein